MFWYNVHYWWRHGMCKLSALRTLCEGNPPMDCQYKGRVRQSFGGFIVVSLGKPLKNCRVSRQMRHINVDVTSSLCYVSYILKDWWSIGPSPWWRHQMETFSALLALCAGNSPVPVNSQHKGQWRGALMFSLICAWINEWVNNREAGDLRRHRGHDDVNVMIGLSFVATSLY